MATISARVIRCVSKRLNNTLVSRESNLVTDLEFDSLGILELVMDLEDEFNINISDRYFKDVKTVKDIIVLLENWNETVIDNSD